MFKEIAKKVNVISVLWAQSPVNQGVAGQKKFYA